MKKEIKQMLTLPSTSEKKKTVTLFLISVFSLLLVMAAYLENFYMKWLFQAILFISQLIILKSLLDDYYNS
jgi:hypothetical protein